MKSRLDPVRRLRYPQGPPPGRLGAWKLPRAWRIPRAEFHLSLPSDPMRLLEDLRADDTEASDPGAGETIRLADLIEFAIQTWRLEKRAAGLDADRLTRERRQFLDSARRFRKFLSRFAVDFKDPAGGPFDTGMQDIEVVSWDEPEGETPPAGVTGPWIKQTVSPIVYQGNRILRRGEVVCVDPGDEPHLNRSADHQE